MKCDELRKILEDTADAEGRVTCERVVEAASATDHPLHKDPNFLWDKDTEAAKKYRLAYAAKLIRRVYIIVRPVTRRQARVPYYVHDPRGKEKDSGYVPLESNFPRPGDAAIIARDELRRVIGMLKRTSLVVAQLKMEDEAADLAQLLSDAEQLAARLAPPALMPSAAQET